MFNKRNRKIIKELIRRRDEVIKRAQMPIPTHLLNAPFTDYKIWLIEPHVHEKFIEEYEEKDDEGQRSGQLTVYKILNGVEDEEGGTGSED